MCGLGSGRWMLESIFGDLNIDYEGFDYSDEIVELACKENPGVRFFQQDVNTFRTEKKYDIVILLSGLHHVPSNAGNVMNNMASCIKEDGYFISIEPTYNNVLAKMFCNRIYKYSQFYDYESERRFSLDELNSFYRNAGLVIERQIYPGLLAYLLWFFNPYPVLRKIGNKKSVKRFFKIERKMYMNIIGRKLSVATFTILRKPK